MALADTQATDILKIINGSHLYGLNHEDSDLDYIGVFVEPPSTVFSLAHTDSRPLHDRVHDAPSIAGADSIAGAEDGMAYSVRKFFSLAMQGNPSILACLFAPTSRVEFATELGWSILKYRDLFVSSQAGPRFKGYLHSQYLRLTGERNDHTPVRPELVEKYGYDTKYAMHALRLGLQGCEFLRSGTITLPMPEDERKLCLAVRHGGFSLDDVLNMIKDVEADLSALVDSNDLPSEPDYDCIHRLSRQIHEGFWG